ncbi:MAG TPA: PAC2 family protein [archaeon]|nr:PAC2 family protein [archaeon]
MSTSFHVGTANLKNSTLLVAFPSTGLVGVIAARHLVEKLKLEPAGFVQSDVFAPVILIQNGLLAHPVRVYHSRKHGLTILTSEQVLHDPTALHKFASDLGAWISKQKFKQVISVSGILVAQESTPGGNIYGVAANASGKKLLEGNGVKVLKEGISTGISPLLLLQCSDLAAPAVQLLGEIAYNKDYAAAASVVRKLNSILKLNVNVAALEEEASQMKEGLSKQLMQLQKAKETIEQEGPEKDHSMMFG